MNLQPKHTVFSPPLLDAIRQRIARGEQSLVFLNRRGYAPVLACTACDWKSECPHCSAYRVFHKIDRTLRCHHCGYTERVPRACPECGNVDIAPLGRGTERLEEQLAELLADVQQAGRRAGAHRAHGRRQHAPARARWSSSSRAGARRRRRRAGGHADGDQGPRLPPHHAGGRGEPRLGAVLQRLPRARAAVQPADAGGRAAPAAMRRRPAPARCGCRPGIRSIRCSPRCAGTTTRPSPRSSSRSASRRHAAVRLPGAAAGRGAHARKWRRPSCRPPANAAQAWRQRPRDALFAGADERAARGQRRAGPDAGWKAARARRCSASWRPGSRCCRPRARRA